MKKSKITKVITSLIAALMVSATTVISSFAATTQAAGLDNLLDFGNDLAESIKKIAEVIAVIAVVILGISCATAGRGWAEKLKSGASGIIIGVAIVSYGASIIVGLFA